MKCVADRCASIRVQVERPAQIMKPARRQPPQQLRQKLQKRNLVRSPERAARRRKSKLNRREPRRPPVLAALVVRFPFSTTREPRKAQMLRRLSPAWRTDSLKHPLSKDRKSVVWERVCRTCRFRWSAYH